MKLFAGLVALLFISLTTTTAQLSTFPYLYDWSGAATISGDGNYSTEGTIPFTLKGSGLSTSVWSQAFRGTSDAAILRLAVDARGKAFTGGEEYIFSLSTLGGGYANSGGIRVIANSTLLNTIPLKSFWDTTITAVLPPSFGDSQFNIDIVVAYLNTNGSLGIPIVCIDNNSIVGGALPIQLASFRIQLVDRAGVLTWTTLSEINNYGFNLQKSPDMKSWIDIGPFIPAQLGSQLTERHYAHVDSVPPFTNYRLKQFDLDGTVHYSQVVSAGFTEVASLLNAWGYGLAQNYPNPFNPTTSISFVLPKSGHVTLTVYNALGQATVTLVDDVLSVGPHSAVWNARNVSSGTYTYVLRTDAGVLTKKMVVVR